MEGPGQKKESELIIYAIKYLGDFIERDRLRAANAVFTLLEIGNALAFEQAIRIILNHSSLSSDNLDFIVDYLSFTKDSNEKEKFSAYIRENITKYTDQISILTRVAEGLEKP